MQNLKSLNNLIAKPVLGANDNVHRLVGKEQVEIYSYEDEVNQMLSKVKEDQRKVLARQLLTSTYQD